MVLVAANREYLVSAILDRDPTHRFAEVAGPKVRLGLYGNAGHLLREAAKKHDNLERPDGSADDTASEDQLPFVLLEDRT